MVMIIDALILKYNEPYIFLTVMSHLVSGRFCFQSEPVNVYTRKLSIRQADVIQGALARNSTFLLVLLVIFWRKEQHNLLVNSLKYNTC